MFGYMVINLSVRSTGTGSLDCLHSVPFPEERTDVESCVGSSGDTDGDIEQAI
jgi:hypothetical protein